MNNTNVSAVATAQTTNTGKHNWLTKGGKLAKTVTMTLTVFCCMAMMCGTTAFAAGTGEVDTSTFITTSCTVLKSVICLIGGGVSLWGVVNLLEGYGNDNPGAKEP